MCSGWHGCLLTERWTSGDPAVPKARTMPWVGWRGPAQNHVPTSPSCRESTIGQSCSAMPPLTRTSRCSSRPRPSTKWLQEPPDSTTSAACMRSTSCPPNRSSGRARSRLTTSSAVPGAKSAQMRFTRRCVGSGTPRSCHPRRSTQRPHLTRVGSPATSDHAAVGPCRAPAHGGRLPSLRWRSTALGARRLWPRLR